MERFDIEDNKWYELSATLKEARYHASACILHERYIYIFGGQKTEAFSSRVSYKVTRKNEKLMSVRSDFIEVYDTLQDEIYESVKYKKQQRP